MNTDIESQLQSAFGARAALLTEHDLTAKPDVALALVGQLPQRRGFILAGVAAAVVLATVGGGVAIAASTGSGHSGTPAGGAVSSGSSTPTSDVAPTGGFSTAANGPAAVTPTPSCTVPSICDTTAADHGRPNAVTSPAGAYSTAANPADGKSFTTITNDPRTAAASPSR
jgi:hypothetical protein